MFAYCNNNPVFYSDDSGNLPMPNKMVRMSDSGSGNSQFKAQQQIALTTEKGALESAFFWVYRNVPVFRTEGERSGSFGAIFLTKESNHRSYPEDVVRHEYGHVEQLKQLGPVNYLLCIMLPSWQEWGVGEYYDKPWEVTAEVLGKVESRYHSQDVIDKGFTYLEISRKYGPLAWLMIEWE